MNGAQGLCFHHVHSRPKLGGTDGSDIPVRPGTKKGDVRLNWHTRIVGGDQDSERQGLFRRSSGAVTQPFFWLARNASYCAAVISVSTSPAFESSMTTIQPRP